MMKKYNLFLFFALILLTTGVFAQKKGYVAKVSTAPQIDGQIDEEWEKSATYAIENLTGGSIDGANDCSATWHALWDDENLYILVEVTDDMLVNNGANASQFWIHDCVEVFFDMLNEKNEVQIGDAADDDKYQYRFIYGLDDEPIYEKPPETGVENVSFQTDKGYNIEIKFPWTTLIGVHSFGDIIVGRSIGVDFQIGDLDDSPLEWQPDGNLVWNNLTGENLKKASSFGTMVLVENNLVDETAPNVISDLASTALGAIEMQLNWTSPGDDLNIGLADKYEIRYSTENITIDNWESANLVETDITPLISGTSQSLIISGLTGGNTYYFAIITTDEAGNNSGISNIASTTTNDADVSEPSTITNLAVETERPISIKIIWTAPGDDLDQGTAFYYEIKYSTSEITDANWESAKDVTNIPNPTIAGTQQSIIVIGLSPETKYYFAIKATDEQKNTSAISNVISGKTTKKIITIRTPMDQFIGTNAFIDDPLDKMQALGFIREYHNWNWDEGDIWSGGGVLDYPGFPNNQNAWNPSYAGGGGWNFDNYYKKLFDAGITVVPCVQGGVKWINGGVDFSTSDKPVRDGLSTLLSSSYEEHSDHLFQYAARYGQTVVDDNLLKLASNQPRVSGLGYLKYIENANEPDGWWNGPDAQFSAEELAAMGSADRDGHEGTMGATFGVKNADPNIKLVMGGLATIDLNYIDKMRIWCEENRKDKKFIYDVINVHHYTDNVSPEAGNLKEILESVVDYRDQFLPDVEVWLSEFGWDSGINETSKSCPAIGDYSKEEVQAQWIIRSYLLTAASGIDRSAQFMLRDSDSDGKIQFNSCGFVGEKNDWSPKPSWYYVYTMRNTLKGYYFAGEETSTNSNVLVYKFENALKDTTIYAVWSPTSNSTVVSNFQLNLPNEPNSLKMIEMVEGEINGTSADLTINRGTVKFDVSERPVFIVATKNKETSVRKFENNISTFVFPNPANENLTIKLTGDKSINNIDFKISNLCGQIIYQQEFRNKGYKFEQKLNISSLTKGVYLLEVTTNNQMITKRFIKE